MVSENWGGRSLSEPPGLTRENFSGLIDTIWGAIARAERARAEIYIAAKEEAIEAARARGIDTSRQEIFLNRAILSLQQGHYDSVVSMASYPIKSLEVGEAPSLIEVFMLVQFPLLYPGREMPINWTR